MNRYMTHTLAIASLTTFSTLPALACGGYDTETQPVSTPTTETTKDHHLGSEESSEAMSVLDTAMSNDNFSTLVAAVQAADLVEALSGEGPFTILAPTDEAFAALPEGTLESLLEPENKEMLQQILTYHVIPAKAMSEDVVSMDSATTLQGDDVSISVDGDTVMINDATVTAVDIECSNGVIHVIDTVLLPPSE